MAVDPTEETIRKEIADAVRILRDDGVHIHRSYTKFKESLGGDPPVDPPAIDPPEGGPPPPKPPATDPPKTTKKGIWWGERE